MSYCREGIVLGTPQTEGIDTSHLTVLVKERKGEKILESHITPKDDSQKRRYFPATNLKEITTQWDNSIGENIFFELNDAELKEEVLYITQKFSDWIELLNKTVYRKKTSKKEIIHILDFENLAKKVPKFVHELTESPGSFIGLCNAKEIINDTSKIMGVNNEKILLLPLEDKLFGVNIPIFTASQLAQNEDANNLSNPLEKFIYSMGISQYLEEIRNKKFLEKIFENETN